MNSITVKSINDTNFNDDFINNINLEDLGLILKQTTNEIENGITGINAYDALDEIELEVFGNILRN